MLPEFSTYILYVTGDLTSVVSLESLSPSLSLPLQPSRFRKRNKDKTPNKNVEICFFMIVTDLQFDFLMNLRDLLILCLSHPLRLVLFRD